MQEYRLNFAMRIDISDIKQFAEQIVGVAALMLERGAFNKVDAKGLALLLAMASEKYERFSRTDTNLSNFIAPDVNVTDDDDYHCGECPY